jgi:hypothetical protein
LTKTPKRSTHGTTWDYENIPDHRIPEQFQELLPVFGRKLTNGSDHHFYRKTKNSKSEIKRTMEQAFKMVSLFHKQRPLPNGSEE